MSLLITDTNQLDTVITIKATVCYNCLLITGHSAAFAVSQETCIGSYHLFADSLCFINTFPLLILLRTLKKSSLNSIYDVYITGAQKSEVVFF